MIVDRFVDVDDSSHRCWLHSNANMNQCCFDQFLVSVIALGLTFDGS